MRVRAGVAAIGICAWLSGSACSNPLGRQYEYEEQVYLNTKGGATVTIDTSIAALVALRGAPLDPSPNGRVDQKAVQKVFEESGCRDLRPVGQPWRRKHRWFIHVSLETKDVSTLASCGMLNWSSYAFTREDSALRYQQTVAAPTPRDPGKVNWDGAEVVAFRLHLPSRIVYHNVRRLDRDEPGDVGRGNILTWEQYLADRRAGTPIKMDVRMEVESILHRTLVLFGCAAAAALAAMTVVVWWTIRRGRAQAKRSPNA